MAVRSRAKRLGIEFDLEISDIQFPAVCPILGIPIKKSVGRGPTPNSPSVDRIDPTKGYTKGNVWVISQKANRMKSDATLEELKAFANWINQSQL